MKTWPHAPLHAFNEKGTYMVTGSTLYKEHHFKKSSDLDYLHDLLLELANQYQWRLEAWALFSNHYHFIAQSPNDPATLRKFVTHLHASSARELNFRHQMSGRKVWYQYRDTQITFQPSYLARLNYVMQNPVKHKIVDCASHYKWCSANWFEMNTTRAYHKAVMTFKTDTVTVEDDF